MRPRIALTLITAGAVSLCWAAAVLLALAWPNPVKGQEITYWTECGAPGTGKRLTDERIVTLTAEEARGLHVGADGYWRFCPLPVPTPDTKCGAEGIGIGSDNSVSKRKEAGWRVDSKGFWIQCDRPCAPIEGQVTDFLTWKQGDNECTTRDAYQSNPSSPARNRMLGHHELGVWEQWHGPMRGRLHEWCDDSKRTRTLATCAPATECDTKIEHFHEGKTFVYDARPENARVPNGKSVELKAGDGTTWPVTCVAGDWRIPIERPAPPPPPRPPVAPICMAQTFLADVYGLPGKSWVSVRSPLRSKVGEIVTAEVVGTWRTVRVTCGADGRFTISP